MSSWVRVEDVPPLPGQRVLFGRRRGRGDSVALGWVEAQTGKVVCAGLNDPTHWMFIPPVPGLAASSLREV